MWKAIRRWWKYLGARLSGKLEESADPKTQLEQSIEEAQQQHRRLTEQAANVIANQKQTQMRLERAVEDYEKSNASARQALLLADEANRDGKTDKVASYTQAAEAFADKIIGLEKQVADLKNQLQQTTQAAEQAKQAVAQNDRAPPEEGAGQAPPPPNPRRNKNARGQAAPAARGGPAPPLRAPLRA